jgi:hypothetical protein
LAFAGIRGAGSGSGATAPAIVFPDGFGAGVAPTAPEAGPEAEPVAVEPAATGVTEVCGAVVVVGVDERWFAGALGGGATTTFSGGGEAEFEPEPVAIGGMCVVPESRIRAVAPAPISSGTSTAAARRAAAPSASHFPRSLADTASSSHSPDGPPPALEQRYKKPDRTASREPSRRSLFPMEYCPRER